MLCHFLGKPPSVFQIPDDPEAGSTLVQSIALEFKPREVDKGQLSWWEMRTDEEKEHVIAGYAACRPHRQKVHALYLSREFLAQAMLDIQPEPDPKAFECIAHLHHGINMGDESIRETFARHLLNALAQQTLRKEHIYDSIQRSEIVAYITRIYCQCIQKGSKVDITKAQEWIRETLARVRPDT